MEIVLEASSNCSYNISCDPLSNISGARPHGLRHRALHGGRVLLVEEYRPGQLVHPGHDQGLCQGAPGEGSAKHAHQCQQGQKIA